MAPRNDSTSLRQHPLSGPLLSLLLGFLAALSIGAPSVHALQPPLPAPLQEERESIQEMLERLRAIEEKRLAGMSGEVETALSRLRNALASKKVASVRAAQSAIVKLLPAAAPLFAPHLDPGKGAAPNEIELSREIAVCLARVPAPALHASAVEVVTAGTLQGKLNAIRVLPGTETPAVVGAVLREVYAKEADRIKLAALRELARLGLPKDQTLFAEAFSSEDPRLAQAVLEAKIAERDASFATAVLGILGSVERAGPLLPTLLAYFKAVPDVVDEEHVEAVIAIGANSKYSTDDRVSALQFLADFKSEMGSKQKRKLKSMVETSQREIASAAQETLAILGDSRARRNLMQNYDQRVESSPERAAPYLARADAWYRIREYSKALPDYQKAIQLSAGEPRSLPPAYIGAARVSSLLGKEKQSANYLRSAPISSEQLRALAADPDFENLRSSRHGKVFGLDDDSDSR